MKIFDDVDSNFIQYETYGHILEDPTAKKVLIITKSYLHAIMHPIFTSLAVLLFCIFCQRCFSLIDKLVQEIRQMSPEEFGIPEQLGVLRRKEKIDEILENIEDIFATPWLCIIIVTNLTFCTVVGRFMFFNFTKYRLNDIRELSLRVIIDFACLIAALGGANILSSRLRELKLLFYKKLRGRQLSVGNPREALTKQELFGKSNFILIGALEITWSKLLFYMGSLMSILAYGILWFSMKNGEYSKFNAYNISSFIWKPKGKKTIM
ncbi:uncharacterized protein NPIL_116761 [Nephila pilipes]|uniref:Uncharacterized protein n=1 Tax=Nephila pilipes TaxID=299642 RepID=A0A8X6IU09_NEPPI|nr:uncharacterized protein NPIL_116761 [Nephila pilipes]